MSGVIDSLVSKYGKGIRDPKISVVIPAYNESDRLGSTLDALERQTYENFDVTVVDDGSSDRTAEIAEERGYKVLRGKRGGVSRARNRGYKGSNGRVVVFLDADTELTENALESIRNSIESGYVGGTLSLESDSNDVFSNMRYGWTNFVSKAMKYAGPIIDIFTDVPKVGSGAAVYCRRDVLRRMEAENGFVFNPKQEVGQDSDMITRMRKYGLVDFIDRARARTSARRYEGKDPIFSLVKDVLKKPLQGTYHEMGTRRAAA